MRISFRRIRNAIDRKFGERHVCPRRCERPVPSFVGDWDYWSTNRWSPIDIWADWARDAWSRFRDKHPRWFKHGGRFYGGTRWPDGFWKPRTCSYCGGVHPEDAIALVELGWESEGTDKGYKKYLHPPGYFAACDRRMNHWRNGGTVENLQIDGPRSPVPPVKVYVMHWTREQCDRINAIIQARAKKEPVAS